MLLMDESASVLMLVTNHLSRDLNDESAFVNGLALSVLGNIASTDMARDLRKDVLKHLTTGTPLTRKKAALACVRLFRVAPELMEEFVAPVLALLNEKVRANLPSQSRSAPPFVCDS